MFKSDWTKTVHGYLDPAEEQRAIRECVPKDIRPDIEKLESMEEIWEFLDEEYGKPSELSTERIDYLHNFQCLRTATTEAAKFKELYRCWSNVHSDLTKVNQLDTLDHVPTLKTFLALPLEDS